MLTSPELTVDYRLSFSAVMLPELEKHRDKVAFIEDATGRKTTYRELIVTVKRLGAALLKHGLKPGEILSICAPNSIEHVFLFYAVARIGAVFHCTNPDESEDLLEHHFKLCEPSILLIDQKTKLRIKHILPEIKSLKAIFLVGDEPSSELDTLLSLMTDEECQDVSDIDPDFDARKVPFAMYHTSGTTGIPKCVVLSQFYFTTSVARRGHEQCSVLREGIIYVITMPFTLCSVLPMMLGHFVKADTTFILPSDLQPSTYYGAIEKYKANTLWMGTVLELSCGLDCGYDFSSVRDFIFGGGAPRKGEVDNLQERMPTMQNIVQSYGSTEAGLICNTPRNETVVNLGSCGKLTPGFQAKIVNYKTIEEVGPYITGELYVKTLAPMMGYYKRPEETSSMIDNNGWIRTGDMAYFDEEGYIYIQNRASDVISHNTRQILPYEIDSIFLGHPGVADSATVGVNHSDAGQVPYCFVVRRNEDNVTEYMLKQILKDQVEPSIVTDVIIEFIEGMPTRGKKLAKLLRAWAKDPSLPRK